MKLSIIIKALNEEVNIARAIESSLKVVNEINGNGEVILADSLSTDSTIKIASQYDIKIIQLTNKEERSCGIGAELGFKIASGEFIYILDADMEFYEGFILNAIEFLDENLSYAGVGGLVNEINLSNIEFKQRYKRKNTLTVPGEVKFLGMGGLYRKEALDQVKYFTNKFLNSYEEFELGTRLMHEGWHLRRLDVDGVKHYGHEIGEYQLLLKRVKSGYIFGLGELLRSMLGKPYFKSAFTNLRQTKTYLFYLAWFVFLLIALLISVFQSGFIEIALIAFIVPLIALSLKKRSIKAGLYAIVSGVINGIGMLIAFVSSQPGNPKSSIDYKIIKR